MLKFTTIGLFLLFYSSAEMIIIDPSLIVPGLGAEGFVINKPASEAVKKFNSKELKIIKFNKRKELLEEVFNIKVPLKIKYDMIILSENNHIILLSYKDLVTAVIGFNHGRVTNDAVSLDKGINYFIFNYGNNEIYQIQNEYGKIYIFKNIRIILFDDNNNDTIDMYLVY